MSKTPRNGPFSARKPPRKPPRSEIQGLSLGFSVEFPELLGDCEEKQKIAKEASPLQKVNAVGTLADLCRRSLQAPGLENYGSGYVPAYLTGSRPDEAPRFGKAFIGF